MSSIMIAAVPFHGHVTPLLAVAENFVERGDDVRFLTGSRFADRVRATGATFLRLPDEADFDETTIAASLPGRDKLKGTAAFAFDFEHVFGRPGTAQYNAITNALAARRADIAFADPMFVGAALLLGHPRGQRPAVVMCGIGVLPVVSRDAAPFGMGLPPARVFNVPRNAALNRLSHYIMRQPYRGIDSQYQQIHGTYMRDAFVDWGRRADAIIQLGVQAFEYPVSDAPTHLHFVGPLSARGSHGPLPDWWSDLDGTRPVVHVTQGTLANVDLRQVIAPTLQALADQDVLVVVATGGRPLDTLPPLPANARAATYLPYDELLPRTAVYVTNGGYGGVQYALRHGVPIVATGGKEDKPEVGARVAWSGVGRRIRTERPTPRALRRAVFAVLGDPRYRQAAQRVSAEMSSAPGFTRMANVVDALIAENRAAPEAGQSRCMPIPPT